MKTESIENMRGIYESSPFNNLLGIKLEKFEEGSVLYSIKVTSDHKNVNQAVHGGVYFSIMDSVMGATVRSVIKQPVTTINTTINFLAPLKNGEHMYASAKVVQLGKSIVTVEAEVKDCNESILARAIGTFKVIKLPK